MLVHEMLHFAISKYQNLHPEEVFTVTMDFNQANTFSLISPACQASYKAQECTGLCLHKSKQCIQGFTLFRTGDISLLMLPENKPVITAIAPDFQVISKPPLCSAVLSYKRQKMDG